ncbi:MAG: PEP/pyruvate-binding domain-containing protein, partial [Anaerolineae bacterium]|nr:PEP/pyruvate-binding domain-containing protein [Anaerolineae bacterium]
MATSLTSKYVLPLADPGATLATVGGKGASLACLVTAGLPVPDGFHVTTAAYRRFVAENGLQPGILAVLEQADASQPATLEAASTAIRALFDAAQMPPDVAGAIALAYAGLAGRNPIVAVRSSATAEDLPEASFAGQQDTFLNIDGYGEVLAAVKRCWASLWTARAISYRARQGVGAEGLSLAVVVQALVPAEAAGILFTANPVTGRRDQAMISAAWGLGEAVVGGLVTPDALVVDKVSGAVVERQTADKQVMTARVNGGT